MKFARFILWDMSGAVKSEEMGVQKAVIVTEKCGNVACAITGRPQGLRPTFFEVTQKPWECRGPQPNTI